MALLVVLTIGTGIWYWYYILSEYFLSCPFCDSIWGHAITWILSVFALLFTILIVILFFKLLSKVKSLFTNKGALSARISRVVNVLSIFENDIGRQFRYLEFDYMSLNPNVKTVIASFSNTYNPWEFFKRVSKIWEEEGRTIPVNGKKYDKVILTPLIMDFHYKGFQNLDVSKVHYNLPPKKPIIEQCIDLFNGMQDYYENVNYGLLEIYPFLGLNTDNYSMGIVRTLKNDISIPSELDEIAYFIRLCKKIILFKEPNS